MFPSTPSATGNRASGARPAQQKPCSKCWTRPRKQPCKFLADSENRRAGWKAGDLKHLVASLLPAPLYRKLVDIDVCEGSDHPDASTRFGALSKSSPRRCVVVADSSDYNHGLPLAGECRGPDT
jgi:hypothetical protein